MKITLGGSVRVEHVVQIVGGDNTSLADAITQLRRELRMGLQEMQAGVARLHGVLVIVNDRTNTMSQTLGPMATSLAEVAVKAGQQSDLIAALRRQIELQGSNPEIERLLVESEALANGTQAALAPMAGVLGPMASELLRLAAPEAAEPVPGDEPTGETGGEGPGGVSGTESRLRGAKQGG